MRASAHSTTLSCREQPPPCCSSQPQHARTQQRERRRLRHGRCRHLRCPRSRIIGILAYYSRPTEKLRSRITDLSVVASFDHLDAGEDAYLPIRNVPTRVGRERELCDRIRIV